MGETQPDYRPAHRCQWNNSSSDMMKPIKIFINKQVTCFLSRRYHDLCRESHSKYLWTRKKNDYKPIFQNENAWKLLQNKLKSRWKRIHSHDSTRSLPRLLAAFTSLVLSYNTLTLETKRFETKIYRRTINVSVINHSPSQVFRQSLHHFFVRTCGPGYKASRKMDVERFQLCT